MDTRSQKDKEFILSNLEETYYIEKFISQEDINSLCIEYDNSKNKIYKNTGPITSDIKNYKSPVIDKILNKISLLYPNSEFRSGIFFEVDYPHIIHNDDDFSFPLNYKAFNIPLRYDGDQEPRLVFFDQVYLEGPSKFFNKESNIETYYNKCVYDYKDVINKSDIEFDPYMKEKYLGHIKNEWLEGLSFDTAHHWTPGDAIVFDAVRLHCASDFRKTCSKKLGLSIFTNYRK
jgi:hypothetical protein